MTDESQEKVYNTIMTFLVCNVWIFDSRGAQSKVRACIMLIPVGENVTLFFDFSLEVFYPFL